MQKARDIVHIYFPRIKEIWKCGPSTEIVFPKVIVRRRH